MKGISYEEHYADMDVDELEAELCDIGYAIDDEIEKSRMAFFPEHEMIHMERIKQLKEERAYVRKLIKELMGE